METEKNANEARVLRAAVAKLDDVDGSCKMPNEIYAVRMMLDSLAGVAEEDGLDGEEAEAASVKALDKFIAAFTLAVVAGSERGRMVVSMFYGCEKGGGSDD